MKIERPITSSHWTFGVEGRDPYTHVMRLQVNGEISGYQNTNEHRWAKDGDKILFFDAAGEVSSVFARNSNVVDAEYWSGVYNKNSQIRHQISRKLCTANCYFRTHFWNDYASKMYHQLQSCWGEVPIVAADYTRNFEIENNIPVVAHAIDTFKQMGLPLWPSIDKVMWFNGDYVLYQLALREQADYFIIIEYDVYPNLDLRAVISDIASDEVDLAIGNFGESYVGWAWHDRQQKCQVLWNDFYGIEKCRARKAYHSFFPVVVVSRDLALSLYSKRIELARVLSAQGTQAHFWPFCESFVPSEAMALGYNVKNISDYLPSPAHLSISDAMTMDEAGNSEYSLAHPTLDGADLVNKIFVHAQYKLGLPAEEVAPWLRNRYRHTWDPGIRALFHDKFVEIFGVPLG
jgi:hypothetical protein